MANKPAHLDPSDIDRFLDGGLNEREEATVIRHLDTCPVCQWELETAAGGAQWWTDARAYLGADAQEPALVVGAARVEALVEQDGENTGGLSLAFLAPTDDPAMLGRIGVYEISGVIGRGGTGIVLKAFERALNRFVAIKVLAPHLATSGAARKRFAREAQAAAAVVHEHIVPIHAVDEHAGLPYMVMRYVPGRSLQERLTRQGPLELQEVLRIGLQTAAGLAAAHAQGLIHRDVKPANILLENGVERVMLTDFGLARTVDDASLTCSGMIAGTPQYMAPEQARGEAIDHRTDLFSLGSVLYAMCAGHSPFRAETTMGVLHRICQETPRPLRELNPRVPAWLERVVRRLHAKDPDKRFQSAEEVAEVLERRLAQLQCPGSRFHEPWWQRLAGYVREEQSPRQRVWMAAAVTAGVVALALAVTEVTGVTGLVRTAIQATSAGAQGVQSNGAGTAAAMAVPTWDALDREAAGLRDRVEQMREELLRQPTARPESMQVELGALREVLDVLEHELPESTAPADVPRGDSEGQTPTQGDDR